MVALQGVMQTVSELFQLLWHRKLWWLMPMVIVLLILAVLVLLAGTTGVGPFIYTLF